MLVTLMEICESSRGSSIKDYLPKTKEEKIITCADNLIFGNKRGTIEMAFDRFLKEVGKEYAERVKKLYKEVLGFKGQS